jgi:nicotinamide-nucleotide amidase
VLAEIIAIGSELLTPFRQDTNSLYLTTKLNELGVNVAFKDVVGDNAEHLSLVAQIALRRADIVIFMGGLGPTEDDLTRECVAEALGVRLVRNQDLVADLYKRFASRRTTMTDNNLQQADLIEGAESLPNPLGSAPGQWLETTYDGEQRLLMLLPGPPFELERMFAEECLPRLKAKLPPAYIATRVLRLAMIGESQADSIAAPVYTKYDDIQTTILAGAGEVQFHLRASSESQLVAQDKVDRLAEELEDALGEQVFSSGGETLEQIVGYYLQMRNATLAVAESCTGGLLAERITSVSGSSRYFLGGAVVYSNELKTLMADVPPLLIQEQGAVSKQVAIALADGIRKKCRASIGVGITGVAGPTGGTEDKPVGLVYCAVADSRGTEFTENRFPGTRERIRLYSTQRALDMVRRRLI